MKTSQRQYPHPVLSPSTNEFVNCEFQSSIKGLITKTSYVFEVKCTTTNSEFKDMINAKKAYYAIQIDCPATRFRKIFSSFIEEFTFEIPADVLNGRVELCIYILAGQDLPQYENRSFHPDFAGYQFKVFKADKLAIGEDQLFYADKEIDPLKRISSIFTFGENPMNNAPPVDLDITGDKIVINLSKQNIKSYKNLRLNSTLRTTLLNLLVFPALISLLEMAKSGDLEEYDNLRWYRVLDRKLIGMGIDIGNPGSFTQSTFIVAQKVIDNPLTGSLKVLEKFVEGS